MHKVVIDSKEISDISPVYIVAELSGNHNQSYERAEALVRAAAEAGADAVKLQTYTPDTITIDCDSDCFRLSGTIWKGRTLYDLYQEAFTPWEWQERLMQLANQLGLACFSSPFDDSAVAFLEGINTPAYKIASSEITDIGLLNCVAATGKPVVISTGMATLGEIETAVDLFHAAGVDQIILLKCTSAYPAKTSDMNLWTLPHMANVFDTLCGLSDHTLGIESAIASVALGGRFIEKHMTLSRSDGGADAAFSLEPQEFSDMVQAVRETEKALGQVHYGPTEAEAVAVGFRRSLFVVADIAAGEIITADNVRSIRPGNGLATCHLPDVIGKHARLNLNRGTPLDWNHIE